MSYQKLNDETFPASLLMEFDELDDEIPISPSRLLAPETINTAIGTRSPVTTSHSSNSFSGNYSLSTENENGSGSSTSSHPTAKYRSSTSKRAHAMKDAKRAKASSKSTTTGGQKRAKSMENLGSSHAVFFKQQKYGHVKSKVKQFIDEAAGHRRVLVRHKSMPETTNVPNMEEDNEFDRETSVDVLREMLKEKATEVDTLQRHLHFSEIQREDIVAKIESLKRKIETMRFEDTKRERERQRERDLEKDREKQLVLAGYLQRSNQTVLNKIYASTSSQTSPEGCPTFNISTLRSDESFERLLAENFNALSNSSTGPRAKRALQYALDGENEETDENNNDQKVTPDSATHPESSPEYPQLLPATGPMYVYQVEPRIEPSVQDCGEVCRECAKKQKKKQKKKTRLASLFCIKKVE